MNLFKPFNKLFCLFLLLIIAGCQNDQLLENVSSTVSKKNVEQKSLKDLPNLIPVVENLKKIKPKTNHYARTTETFLGVDNVITDDIYVYKDDSGYSTYSFKIDNPENNLKFENLHLIETENGFVAYIMSYDPDSAWYEDYKKLGNDILNLRDYYGDITKYTLERDIIYTTNSTQYTVNSNGTIEVCIYSTYISGCSCNEHDDVTGYNGCQCKVWQTDETCNTIPAGGSGNYSPGDSGTTGNNGDSGNNGGNQNAGGSGVSNPCNSSGGITGTVIVGTQPISGIGTGCSPNQTVVVGLTTMYDAFLQQLQQNSFAYGWYMNPNNIYVWQSMHQYLSSPNADIQFALELVNLAMQNNATFSFDNTIDSNNALNFGSIDEFKNYLEDIENSNAINFEIVDDTQNGEKIARVEFPNGLFNSVKVNIKQKISPYSVLNVTSYLTGMNLFDSWEQKEYIVNEDYNDSVRIDLYGTKSVKIFIDGIGTIYTYEVHYVILINKNIGQIYSAYQN